jgi:hypothetical protein
MHLAIANNGKFLHIKHLVFLKWYTFVCEKQLDKWCDLLVSFRHLTKPWIWWWTNNLSFDDVWQQVLDNRKH